MNHGELYASAQGGDGAGPGSNPPGKRAPGEAPFTPIPREVPSGPPRREVPEPPPQETPPPDGPCRERAHGSNPDQRKA